MPRQRSRGSSGSRPAPRAPLRNPPQPVASAPPPAPAQGRNGSVVGGIGATIADGLAFGTGSAIARRAADVMLGPRVIQHETVASPGPAAAVPAQNNNLGASDACNNQIKAMQECLNNYGSDISKCQFYMDMLQECRRSSSAALSA